MFNKLAKKVLASVVAAMVIVSSVPVNAAAPDNAVAFDPYSTISGIDSILATSYVCRAGNWVDNPGDNVVRLYLKEHNDQSSTGNEVEAFSIFTDDPDWVHIATYNNGDDYSVYDVTDSSNYPGGWMNYGRSVTIPNKKAQYDADGNLIDKGGVVVFLVMQDYTGADGNHEVDRTAGVSIVSRNSLDTISFDDCTNLSINIKARPEWATVEEPEPEPEPVVEIEPEPTVDEPVTQSNTATTVDNSSTTSISNNISINGNNNNVTINNNVTNNNNTTIIYDKADSDKTPATETKPVVIPENNANEKVETPEPAAIVPEVEKVEEKPVEPVTSEVEKVEEKIPEEVKEEKIPEPTEEKEDFAETENSNTDGDDYYDIGEELETADATYVVTETDGKFEVEYCEATNEKATSVTIPKTITVNGVKCAVTSIADEAFKGNKNLKTVNIGSNVTEIGDNAFWGCKNLKSIKINSKKLTMKKVGTGAFKKTSSKLIVKVPKAQFKAYKKIFRKRGLNTKAMFKKF